MVRGASPRRPGRAQCCFALCLPLPVGLKLGAVSKVEEIERVIEGLPAQDFKKLSAWMAWRGGVSGQQAKRAPVVFRDPSAFLNSYSAEDEGLYDDARGP